MQQFQSKYHYGTPLSINSSSSSTSVSPNKLNRIFPSHRLSQTSASIQSITPNQSRLVTNCDNELKLSEKVKYILLIMILTFTYAFLPTITIELATTLAKYKKENDLLSSMNEISNLTQINNEIRLEEHVFFGHLFYFFITELEPMFIHNFDSSIIIITLICALLFNMLTITIPFQYTSFANAASFIVAIPCITLIDRYLLNIKYSALFILAILCSLSSILLSMIPKTCFQAGEARKMKQALGLINKDLNISAAAVGGLLSTGGTTDGTSSTFEEIKTQRRIRNALLYNELKT
ncbi:unnamed protein product [Rotaria magnacalcarata]|uniref:Uncharacterized protein n=1 Tax=Rotaria magnacalcarata TaxID=392030 RepID=A0A820EQW1_9BILA|nr:unnamed protein product [Rotaria magnacalcarata]